uniref:Uncharacterized protein n=1 Tax=Sphaerodactylus townsendi TaxID=933632 RepID=A0ACB8G2F1_9SAUR
MESLQRLERGKRRPRKRSHSRQLESRRRSLPQHPRARPPPGGAPGSQESNSPSSWHRGRPSCKRASRGGARPAAAQGGGTSQPGLRLQQKEEMAAPCSANGRLALRLSRRRAHHFLPARTHGRPLQAERRPAPRPSEVGTDYNA